METFLKDGRPLSVSGTAAFPVEYEYGVESVTVQGAAMNARFTREIRIGFGGVQTEWTKTYEDMVGRVLQVSDSNTGITE